MLLVDDHPLWRQTLRTLLENNRFAKVVAEASDGARAVELARSRAPDVVVMDIQLPAVDGIEATRRLVAAQPELKVLVLASSDDRAQIRRAIEAGACGYLLKTASSADVTDAVRRIHEGELVFPRSVAGVVLDELRGRQPAPTVDSASGRNVFRREGEYWTVAFEGRSFRLKDTRGLRFLSHLLAQPGREVHALDVVAAGAGTRMRRAREVADDILDADARASLKQRIAELSEEQREAESWDDHARASRASEEIQVLVDALAQGVGLAGRGRQTRTNAERARVNVTMAIKAAVAKVAEHSPALGSHLQATVRTGVFCSYDPDPRVPISWTS